MQVKVTQIIAQALKRLKLTNIQKTTGPYGGATAQFPERCMILRELEG